MLYSTIYCLQTITQTNYSRIDHLQKSVLKFISVMKIVQFKRAVTEISDAFSTPTVQSS